MGELIMYLRFLDSISKFAMMVTKLPQKEKKIEHRHKKFAYEKCTFSIFWLK